MKNRCKYIDQIHYSYNLFVVFLRTPYYFLQRIDNELDKP